MYENYVLNAKQPYKPDDEVISLLGLSKEKAATITFYKPVGCEDCVNGYKGRLAIFEIMEMTNEIAKLTIEKADASVIRQQAVADGMTLLIQDGIRKIA